MFSGVMASGQTINPLSNLNSLSLSPSAGCFFSGEVHAQSAVSDLESDTERGSTDGAPCLVTAPSPESFVNATSDQPADTPKPRIPKVTSDSFISELVSDREPAKISRDVRSAAPSVLEEEETILREGEVQAPCAGEALSPGDRHDPQWSNVDLGEAQAQQAQTGVGQDSADTCSLSSVATYTLAMEDLYGTDEHPVWAWVSGGGCSVDSHSQLSWFICSVNTSCELNKKAPLWWIELLIILQRPVDSMPKYLRLYVSVMSVHFVSLFPINVFLISSSSFGPVCPIHESVCHPSPDGGVAETNL